MRVSLNCAFLCTRMQEEKYNCTEYAVHPTANRVILNSVRNAFEKVIQTPNHLHYFRTWCITDISI